jgi:hypothetical protein
VFNSNAGDPPETVSLADALMLPVGPSETVEVAPSPKNHFRRLFQESLSIATEKMLVISMKSKFVVSQNLYKRKKREIL